jgi:hypothetical protein
MNATILLISVIAIGAAVLGPLYGRASAEHLLDTRLDERAPYTTGLTAEVPASTPSSPQPPVGRRFVAPPVAQLVAAARAQFGAHGSTHYWGPAMAWAQDPSGSFRYRGIALGAPVYWREGMCGLVALQGRCPTDRGEVLMQATMARTLGLAVGDTFPVTYYDTVAKKDAHPQFGRDRQQRREVGYVLTGTYTVPHPNSPAWFDLSRFTGFDNLKPPPTGADGSTPVAPALLAAPASLDSEYVVAGVDRPIRTSAVDLGDMGTVLDDAAAFKASAIDRATGDDVDILPDLDLRSVVDQVRSERIMLSRILVAALAPLVVLALLLLFALVSSAAEVRRPHLALAKLRGHSRGQVLWFALSEPFAVVAVATPVAVLIALAAAHLVARTWLHPGIPVGFDTVTVLSLVVVVGASLVSSTIAALGVIREPLSSALASSGTPRPSSRTGLVLRSAVVAVAVVAVANLLVSGDQSSQLLALLTPMLIALAVAVGGALLLRVLSRAWLRRTADAGSTPAYLASRRLGRRRDLANLMVPLLLAVAVLTFASAASATSDDWRVSRADAQVGASRTYLTSATPGRLLAVTRKADPAGHHLMAVVVNNAGDDMRRSVFVDSSRLADVASWDPSWSDRSLRSLASGLVLDEAKRIHFTGRRLTLQLREVKLSSATKIKSSLQIQYVDDTGEQRDELVGAVADSGDQTLSTTLEDCRRACLLEQLYVTGDAVSVSDVQGHLTIASASMDGKSVDWRLDRAGAWRPARPFPVSLVDPPVVVKGGPGGLRLQLFLGRLPPGNGPQNAQVSGFARVTPSTTPDVAPALVADDTSTETADQSGSGIALTYPHSVVVGKSVNGQDVPMRVVDRVAALPIVGTQGELADLETGLVEFEPPSGALVTTELWVGPGTPASMVDAVRNQGVALTDRQDRAAVLHGLRTDAFSLGLRLFLVVGAATLLLAIFGVLASAVLQSRWRSYEVASLRVVGVSQRSLVRGSTLEYVVLLGVAVLLGVLSAWLALRLVLPSISLGTAPDFAPPPAYAAHWEIVLGVGAGLFVLAALISVLVSRRITRLGRPATLRWAEQG